MVAVPKLWPGSTVVCLGCGPSLTRHDVEACRGRARVIAINQTALPINGIPAMAPWADILYSSDVAWWRQTRGAQDFAGLKYAIVNHPARAMAAWPDIQILANTGVDGIETRPTGLRTIRNSGGAAINLAVHLGATRILLLGYDMGRSGKKTHYFGEYPSPLKRSSPYADFRASFATMVRPLRALGVLVVNCSRETALTAFPRAALADVLPAAVAA